ncbi:endocuticle structural glycoprotein SgAbd-9-like [Glossina fuscipes fuscipes]
MMAFVKLLQISFIINVASYCVSGAILDNIFPTIMQEFYKFAPTEQGYRFSLDEPNGSKRDEMGIILNPGTPEQQLVVMGTYTVYDEKTDIETITMYTADKDGYRTRYKIKNRKLSANVLKSAAG